MGRYSDSENSDYYSKSKKKKKRERSRSVSSHSSASSYDRKYSKKKKKTKKKYRSPARERQRSRSRSRRRSPPRKRSRSPRRRSRSQSPRRRSRSRSRSPRRRSRSPRQRSPSPSPRGSRTIKRERSRSRSPSSRSYRRYSKDRTSKSRSPVKIKQQPKEDDSISSLPGLDKMNPVAQAEMRMQMALKAAALADQKLKKQGVLSSSPSLIQTEEEINDQLERAKLIDNIERDGFDQTAFRSTKSQKEDGIVNLPSHNDVIFGAEIPQFAPTKPKIMYQESDTPFHPIYYESDEVKFERWKIRLMEMRKQKLAEMTIH
ncbi:uncharacterized protein LOC141911089 [Tubulanus polymorphus]|uniref:uncharacterized protein LOC141911089 n=1 Tax=Tubulanus polymorphus TaxID=672921 RepID=UPI003DA20006